jgi:hypothetical protein
MAMEEGLLKLLDLMGEKDGLEEAVEHSPIHRVAL